MTKKRTGAVSSTTASDLSTLLRPSPVLTNYVFDQDLDNLANAAWDIHDGRRFRPDRSTAPPSHNRRASRVVAPKNRPIFSMRFADPTKIVLCARRKRRKQVLFAKNKVGKAGMRFRKPRYTFWSRIGC